jgi:hypothetical protein
VFRQLQGPKASLCCLHGHTGIPLTQRDITPSSTPANSHDPDHPIVSPMNSPMGRG